MRNLSDRPYIRVIGDVHGRLGARPKRKERNVRDLFPSSPFQTRGERRRNYLNLIERSTYSIQVGDLGFSYDRLSNVDDSFHRVIAGNHDNLPKLTPHFLGDFGIHRIPLPESAFEFFFVRGARSVDVDRRVEGLNWWPNEELSEKQAAAALQHYESIRPQIVISHDCPTEIVPLAATLNLDVEAIRTNALLQLCFDSHPPELWIFGHHHRNWTFNHQRGTKFVCVGELGYYDFDEAGTPMFEVPQ